MPCVTRGEKRREQRSNSVARRDDIQRSRTRSRFAAGTVSAARSALMSRIGAKNSRPELIVRRVAHRLGFRFRLHRRDLPGTPDIVFPGSRRAVFVHGCFWHRHPNCTRSTTPKTRAEYWENKFAENVERDIRAIEALRRLGWKVLVIWECETFEEARIEGLLRKFLRSRRNA
ncbi:very short patch repair endonuclease [Bradyrhizobium sp. RDT46]|uniref:very short patch repair endonuclease n=1 Tax=Bradyrhizobium sp. RDT46 TaxID=3341829 RepID=UPI0035C6A0CB